MELKGGIRDPKTSMHLFATVVLGHKLALGVYHPRDADVGGRIYDSINLLLQAEHANFSWNSYTKANIMAGALKLGRWRAPPSRLCKATQLCWALQPSSGHTYMCSTRRVEP
jgi:hypothetical protein